MSSTAELLRTIAAASETAPVPVLTDSVSEASIDRTKRVFKSASASMQMCSDAGTRIIFIRGRFITDDPEVIEYLDRQITKYKVPGLSIDPGEMYYDANIHDPIAALRGSIRKELIEEARLLALQASGTPGRDMGNYEQGRLNPANTTSIAPVAAGSGPRG
jgi:hypothetical protein